MSTLEKVRALFVPGETVECVENTYIPDRAGRRFVIGTVGKSVWSPSGEGNYRGSFPTRAGDVVSVDETSATWKIGRGEHTVTYRRVG